MSEERLVFSRACLSEYEMAERYFGGDFEKEIVGHQVLNYEEVKSIVDAAVYADMGFDEIRCRIIQYRKYSAFCQVSDGIPWLYMDSTVVACLYWIFIDTVTAWHPVLLGMMLTAYIAAKITKGLLYTIDINERREKLLREYLLNNRTDLVNTIHHTRHQRTGVPRVDKVLVVKLYRLLKGHYDDASPVTMLDMSTLCQSAASCGYNRGTAVDSVEQRILAGRIKV